MNKYILLTASIVFSLGVEAATDEILCDDKTYAQIQSEQYVDGNFQGTINDACRNFAAINANKENIAGSGPTQEALVYLNSDSYVLVDTGAKWWVFIPRQVPPSSIINAIVIVPGGNVDSGAYSSLAYNAVRQLTENRGINTMAIIPRYPATIYGYDEPCNAIGNDPSQRTLWEIHTSYSQAVTNPFGIAITQWIFGGHSEGGAGVGNFMTEIETANHVEEMGIKGNFYQATFPVVTVQHNLPANFCSIGLMGGDDIAGPRAPYETAKALGLFPEKTIYYDWTTGWENGIHSYHGNYCPLTPAVGADAEGYGGELQYYELEPDPSLHPLNISRVEQNEILYGDGTPGNAGILLNFAAQAFTDEIIDGQVACQIPFTK